ncbi:MAG: hypothetical protein WC838_02335 [Candidatus Margulisiibacteriota bacterium]|jgi:hypothetical protein
MRQFIFIFSICLITLFSSGCGDFNNSAPVSMNITAIDSTPLEIDILADDTNGNGTAGEGYIAEEISVKLKAVSILHGSASNALVSEGNLPGITLTSYRIEYTLQNAAGSMPAYEGATQIYLRSGENGAYSVRAVTFVQKDWVRTTFGAGTQVNTSAKITFRGRDDAGNPVTVIGNFEAIFANFVER